MPSGASGVAFVCLLCASAMAGAMPDINVQYEFSPAAKNGGSARSTFAKRASQLAASIAQTDADITKFGNAVVQALRSDDVRHMPSSFLSSRLQPVDANRVRKSLAVTEPVASPAEAGVNVIIDEDVGSMLGTAKYKGMLAEIIRLQANFDHGVAELEGVA